MNAFKFTSKDHVQSLVGFGFLAVFLLMMLVTWLSMSTLQGVNTGMSELFEDMSRKSSRAYQMRDFIRLRSGAVSTLVQTENLDERDRIFSKILNYTLEYEESRDELSGFESKPSENLIFKQINGADQRVAGAYEVASKELNTINQDPMVLRAALNNVQLHEMVLLNHLNKLVEHENQLAKEALESNQALYQKTKNLLSLLVGAAFTLAIAISATVARCVSSANSKIAHLANHDDLTGLHNRRSFESHLQQTIANAERSENTYGLLYLDLDRFKIVNDTCGHHAGDLLLIQLTELMQERLRKGDLFARVGGDEFAIIAQGQSLDDISSLAEELRVIVHDFTFHYKAHSFKVSLSIGVAPIDKHVQSLEQVLADVDSACYVAKKSGRNRIHITQDDDAEVVQYRSNLAGIQSIRNALSDNRLALFYQPIFEIKDSSIEIAHCEILLRIRSENGEMYSPTRLIPIAEKYNVMTEIDQWVFTQLTQWLVDNKSANNIPTLLVNLSGQSLANDEFTDFIVQRLQSGDVDPSKIAFEISEGAAVKHFQKFSRFIEKIRPLGSKLALDDFGSGFSSFNYLRLLNFDYLKIDGSMVRNIASDEVDRQMISAINQIGQTVGARTIAGFVEDDEALECLRELNVNYAQGYGLCMPSPLTQLSKELFDKKSCAFEPIHDTAQKPANNSTLSNTGNTDDTDRDDHDFRQAS